MKIVNRLALIQCFVNSLWFLLLVLLLLPLHIKFSVNIGEKSGTSENYVSHQKHYIILKNVVKNCEFQITVEQ